MTDRKCHSLGQVVEQLQAEGHVPDPLPLHSQLRLQSLDAHTPWYVRAMVGLGGWVASLMVIVFLAGLSIGTDGAVLAVGAVLLIAAMGLRLFSGHDFVVQATLAAGLAGQAMLLIYLTADSHGDWLSHFCLAVIGLNAFLFLLFPDRLYRLLCLLFCFAALVVWLYAQSLQAWVVLVSPLAAALWLLLMAYRQQCYARGLGRYVWPAENGLLLSALAVMMLSTVYLLPDVDRTTLYPRPWISSVLLGCLLLSLLWRHGQALLSAAEPTARWGLIAGAAALVAASWAAPGVLLALCVLLLGWLQARPAVTGTAVAFLVVFLIAWFYGLQVSMAVKALCLLASGALLLGLRPVLARLMARKQEAGA